MAKLKDGFYKQTAEAIGSDLHVLLAGGGSKALSDFATSTGVVTALGTNGNYVTWTKNGTANNLVVPYAAVAEGISGIYSAGLPTSFSTGRVTHHYNILVGTEGLFPNADNANSILTVNRHAGNYLSQLGFSSDKRLYFRSASAADINSITWNKIAYVSEIPTKVSQLTNDSGYVTGGPYLPLAGGNMADTATIKFTANGGIIQTTATTHNAASVISWYKGTSKDANYNYSAQIGWYNMGDTDGAMYLVPNPQNAEPWGGTVGLFIGKNTLKWNNQGIIHSGNIGDQSVSYANSAGRASTVTIGTSAADAYRAIVVTDGSNGLYTAGTGTGKPRYNYATGDVKATSFTTDGGNFIGNLTGTASKAIYLAKSVGLSSNGNTNTNKYIKFGSIDVSDGAWSQCTGHLFFYDVEAGGLFGTLGIHVRSSNTISSTTIYLYWTSLSNLDYASCVYAVKTADGKFDLYFKPVHAYRSMAIEYLGAYPNKITLSNTTSYTSSITPASTSSLKAYATYAETAGSVAWTDVSGRPTALKNPNSISFKDAAGTAVSYDGSSTLDLTGGIYYAYKSTRSDTVLGSYTSNGGQQNPNYFGTNRVGFLMMNTTVNGDSNYKDWLIMDCYGGNDVGGGVAFGVNRQKLGAYIMRSEAARTSWKESAELLGTHNYTSYVNATNFPGINKTGTVTSVATGTGLTGGTITSSGTISINSDYQTYISNGNTAYGWGNHASAKYMKAVGRHSGSMDLNKVDSTMSVVTEIRPSEITTTNLPSDYGIAYGCMISARDGNSNYGHGKMQILGCNKKFWMRATQGVGEANDGTWCRLALTSDIPSVGNGTVTINQAGTSKGSFTLNQSTAATINLTDTNYYPTAFSWTGGTAAGPTGSLTGVGMSSVSFGAIPAASSTASGIVTTGNQSFSGQKTFNTFVLANYITPISDTTGCGIGTSAWRYYEGYFKNLYTNYIYMYPRTYSGTLYLTGFKNTPSSTSSLDSQLYASSYVKVQNSASSSAAVYAPGGFYESSDERLKNLLKPVRVDLDELSKLRKVYYTWKNSSDLGIHLGIVAQDVQKLYPELVTVDSETGYLSLSYDKLSVIALEAIDTLYKSYKELKRRVDNLEKLITNKGIL